jgi:hypothetical protein
MKKEIQIYSETSLCPTASENNSHGFDMDAFPQIKGLLKEGFEIKYIKTHVFDLISDNISLPQITCVAVLERNIEE